MPDRNAMPIALLRRAFTLVEVIVVIVILGVISAAAVPRLVGSSGRLARARCQALAEVFSAAAKRSELSGQSVAVDLSSTARTASVSVLTTDRRGERVWKSDALLPRADLADVAISLVQIDGADVSTQEARVIFEPARPRPAVRVALTEDRGGGTCVVEMPSAAGEARVIDVAPGADPRDASALPPAIDLDEQGKDREAW